MIIYKQTRLYFIMSARLMNISILGSERSKETLMQGQLEKSNLALSILWDFHELVFCENVRCD